MNTLYALQSGFATALSPAALLACLSGCLLGTLIGILPGIGTATTIAILLPLAFGQDPTLLLIIFTGIYMGAQYGGSTTAILMNIPGESSAVATALDGYRLARKGRGGTALAVAAVASFIGGTIGLLGLAFLSPLIADYALRFGPPEQFLLIAFALLLFCSLGKTRLSLLSLLFGMLVGTIGGDPVTGTPRFTLGIIQLNDGVDFVVFAMGLLGLGEILANMGAAAVGAVKVPSWRQLIPQWAEIVECKGAIARGSILGFALGVLPGLGTAAASFLAYGLEQRVSKRPEEFGTGRLEGVAAPESANNASVSGALVPMLTLGIPGSASTALMLSVLVITGITPGPLLFVEHPDIVWGVIASLFLANIILLILNLPLVPVFASLSRIKYEYLFPVIMIFLIVGAYSVNGIIFDIWLMIGFGVLGFGLKSLGIPLAPAILGLVLGPLAEARLRASLDISRGEFAVFIDRPISLVITIAILLFVLFLVATRLMRARAITGAPQRDADAGKDQSAAADISGRTDH